MNERKIIATAIGAVIEEIEGADVISPSAVAAAVFARFGGKLIEGDPLMYASFQTIKQIACRQITGRFDPVEKPDEDPDQIEMFNGLQTRYPVPSGKGERGDRQYKLLSKMTALERKWNSNRMRKGGESLIDHADRLDAYGAEQDAQQSA